MCGRARCTLRADDVFRAAHRTGSPSRTIDMDRYRPAYNVSPGFNLPVVRRDFDVDGDGYAVHCMRWGLIPSFTKKTEKPDFYKMFNARSESVGEKASFRRLLPKNRCLLAVEGFYEWKKDGPKKQPYYIHFKDERPLVFAALYDSWKNSEGEVLYTFTILTTSSSSALQWLHDRMPVILGDKDAIDAWLDDKSASKFNTLLKPYEEADLVWYPVTPAMGKISFDGPECVKPVQVKEEEKGTISKFFSKKVKKEEKESDQDAKNTESIKIDPHKSIKKELEDEDKERPGSMNPEHTKEAGESESGMNLPKSEQEEHVTEDKAEKASGSDTLDYSKRGGSTPPDQDDPTNTKPESEKHLANTELNSNAKVKASQELNSDENDKFLKSPARKKSKIKSGDNKQPTLLSYFGKK